MTPGIATRFIPALALCVAGGVGCRAPAAEAVVGSQSIHLVVLHTNDIHGQVIPRPTGGILQLSAQLRAIRSELALDGIEPILLDGGDWFQGTPEGALDKGLGFSQALALLGHDAVCVGNHEFDHGLEVLGEILARTGLPAVLANVRDPATGALIPGVDSALIIERAGLRIAIVGLLTPATPEISHADTRTLLFEDPVARLGAVLDELRASVDLVIPLTHLGVIGDMALARAFPELPLIVGGHSHTTLVRGLREGTVQIVQAGDKARFLGRVDLWLDGEGNALRSEASLIAITKGAGGGLPDPSVSDASARLLERSSQEMEEVVGRLEMPLRRARGLRSSTAGNLICDVMRERAGADVALQNKGGIRAVLEAGVVTRRDLFEILPFGNTLVILDLPGSVLHEAVRRAVEGTTHSGLECSGMRIAVSRSPSGEANLRGIQIGGKPLEPARVYRVATNSFLASGGDAYLDVGHDSVGNGSGDGAGGVDRPEQTGGRNMTMLDTGLILRGMLEDAFRIQGSLRADPENRYHQIPASQPSGVTSERQQAAASSGVIPR